MTRRSRILMGITALLIASTFILPLWRVDLVAPQYPEGLGLLIGINEVKGVEEFDIQNINALNHYIGMKPIEPDSIPELRYMPYVVIALILLAGAVALIGRRRLLYVWLLIFAAVAVVGLIDFYKWEYDYGHNLDLEHAAIQVPGMSYQPPLIGSKQLLNITAKSWPALGGMALFAAMLLSLAAIFMELRGRRSRGQLAFTALLLLAGGCASGPQPIAFGEDECSHCQMAIVDQRYGTELVTDKGKVHKFDSIECMASFYTQEKLQGAELYVTPYNAPGTLVKVDDALILHSEQLPSPMGGNLTAFTGKSAEELAQQYGGAVISQWTQVLELVQEHPAGHH
ncbi:MAG TPA: nitrous oxide reductase accessory protein NosL [Longimicrobiales bacterium]|nr:nitrous oxide reductase accessory protein NosL [Longimicrobiales bacterium]